MSFAAALDDDQGEAILRGRGGPLTTIARTEPGRFNFFGFDTSLNRWGRVAFTAELDAEFGFDEGLFCGRGGGGIRTHYLASSSRFQRRRQRPIAEQRGQVAFFERLDDGTTGVFRSRRERFITIAGEDLSPDDPSVNDRGLVAFTAAFVRSDEFVQAIMTGRGGAVTTVADTTGDYGSVDNPSLDDGGEVAFVADLDFVTRGVFTGPDPVDDRVIATGEQLDGSTVAGLQFCREGSNDSGQLTLAAQLDDGARTAIFRATPAQ